MSVAVLEAMLRDADEGERLVIAREIVEHLSGTRRESKRANDRERIRAKRAALKALATCTACRARLASAGRGGRCSVCAEARNAARRVAA